MKRTLLISFLLVGVFVSAFGYPSDEIDLSKIDFKGIIQANCPPVIDSKIIESAKQGNAESQYKYGLFLREKYLYDNSLLLEEPTEGDDALAWFESAALQGHSGACIEAGLIYYIKFKTTLFKEIYHRKAINYLKEGGAESDPQLLMILGKLAYFEKQGNELRIGDGGASLAMFQKAVEMGLPSNPTKLKYRRSSCQPKLSDAYGHMAFIHKQNGRSQECLYYTDKAAAAGDPDSSLDAGEYYYIGYGTAVDRDKAESIWKVLIEEWPSYAKKVELIKAKYSGQPVEKPVYKKETEEDELRKLFK